MTPPKSGAIVSRRTPELEIARAQDPLRPIRPVPVPAPDATPDPDAGNACRLAPEDPECLAYNEAAFQYFLANERKRSERSNRPFLLLLVDLKKPAGATGAHIDAATGAKLFAGLWRCLRETDFVGWYRDGQIAGAVLAQLPDVAGAGADLCQIVERRVSTELATALPSPIAARIQVRVFQLPPSTSERS